MAIRGGMTRSSIAAAIVVTLLLALLIWWRDEHVGVEGSVAALSPASNAVRRTTGAVMAVPTARPVTSVVQPPTPMDGAPDAGAPAAVR